MIIMSDNNELIEQVQELGWKVNIGFPMPRIVSSFVFLGITYVIELHSTYVNAYRLVA